MTERFTKWDAVEHLGTAEDARLYLNACAEEDPGDGSLIRAALNDIARARNMSGLAREAGLSREGLYKALSEDGNPTFTTVMRITRALGLQLHVTASPSHEVDLLESSEWDESFDYKKERSRESGRLRLPQD